MRITLGQKLILVGIIGYILLIGYSYSGLGKKVFDSVSELGYDSGLLVTLNYLFPPLAMFLCKFIVIAGLVIQVGEIKKGKWTNYLAITCIALLIPVVAGSLQGIFFSKYGSTTNIVLLALTLSILVILTYATFHKSKIKWEYILLAVILASLLAYIADTTEFSNRVLYKPCKTYNECKDVFCDWGPDGHCQSGPASCDSGVGGTKGFCRCICA